MQNIIHQNFLNIVYNTVLSYFKKFNLIKLIYGVIKTRLLILSIVGPLYAFDLITWDQSLIVSCHIIYVMILYSFCKIPVQSRFVVPWFINLSFNCIIASILIYITIKICPFAIISVISFSVFSDYDPFSDNIVYMNSPGGPSDPSGGGPSGGGPSGGPGGDGGPNGPSGGELSGKTDKDRSEEQRRIARTVASSKYQFFKNWMGEKTGSTFPEKIQHAIENKGINNTHLISIKTGIGNYFKTDVEERMKNDISFKQTIDRVMSSNSSSDADVKDYIIATNFINSCIQKVIFERSIDVKSLTEIENQVRQLKSEVNQFQKETLKGYEDVGLGAKANELFKKYQAEAMAAKEIEVNAMATKAREAERIEFFKVMRAGEIEHQKAVKADTKEFNKLVEAKGMETERTEFLKGMEADNKEFQRSMTAEGFSARTTQLHNAMTSRATEFINAVQAKTVESSSATRQITPPADQMQIDTPTRQVTPPADQMQIDTPTRQVTPPGGIMKINSVLN